MRRDGRWLNSESPHILEVEALVALGDRRRINSLVLPRQTPVKKINEIEDRQANLP